MNIRKNTPGILLVLAIIFGFWIVHIADYYFGLTGIWKIGIGLAAFLFFASTAKLAMLGMKQFQNSFDRYLDDTSIEKLLGGTLGLLLGIVTGVLSSYPLSMIDGAGSYLTLGVFILTAAAGLKIGSRRAIDLLRIFPHVVADENQEGASLISAKVLDTSAIIDGRILDVGLANFLEGTLIVPTFVIEELQHIADSSDHIRRNKGRRGLELLAKMQKHPRIKIDIIETDIWEEREVDAKLIRLCKQVNAAIITNDYNLNKVAELQGIKVLNINELTNAVKVMVYPGETMHTSIVREGKETGQGVGYLEDGTMVVVEDAINDIGSDIEVMVTSVFQTAAGRMIFTRKLREEKAVSINRSLRDVQEVNIYG
ncbi:MAG: PIN domain-containing protein [Syntrophomonadaceae bacterium]|nr:PIN domain-containing protein [Syntrophomonadaceae bacterium]